MILRPYQSKAVEGIFAEWREVQSTLCVAPTGVGKTIILAEVIRKMLPKRSLFICHREELVWQAREKITQHAGLKCEIEMADLAASTNLFNRKPVVIATVQTLISGGEKRRMERFKPTEFGCLVVDEVHHGTSPSYRKIFDYFTAGNPDIKILGVTGTPDRFDEEALGQILQSVAFDYEILDAINDGWLVPVEQQMVHIEGLDFSHIRTTAGDLNGADLNAVMEAESNLQGVASASLQIIGSRRSIVFTASVKQAEVICNIFNRHKENTAGWVCGETSKETRRQLLADFQIGKIQVVCNCGVLTEGFDNPGVECIIMARPTKSRALYAQMAGRSMRSVPGLVDGFDTPEARREAIRLSAKPSCLIVDFCGNSGRHKLMTTADILGGNVSDAAIELAVRKAKESAVPVNMTEELIKAEEELRKKQEEARLREEARRSRLVAKVKYTSTYINPFNVLDLVPMRERGWDSGKVLSEKQRGVILKMGIDPDSLPYAQGKQLLVEQFRRWNNHLCTIKQAACLKRAGYETKDMTMNEASKLITELKNNHWKRQPVAA